MKTASVRWLLFFITGLPFQILTYVLYPLVHLWWRVFVFKKVDPNWVPEPELTPEEFQNAPLVRDNAFHNNPDDHGALTHFGLYYIHPNYALTGLKLLMSKQGNLYRNYTSGQINARDVSGDCVVAWTFAYSLLPELQKKQLEPELKQLASHYLKNLGIVSLDGVSKNWVSARCNNFGVNYCPDAHKGLGQPAAGPQFYTSSSVFALASKRFGGVWTLVFWMHWLIMGGWLWQFSPVLYSKSNKLGYVRDITIKALYVHKVCFGNKGWIRRPIDFIAYKIAEWENPLFNVLAGGRSHVKLPTDAFLYQQTPWEPRTKFANTYISQMINDLSLKN